MMHGENLKLILVRLLHVSAVYVSHQLGIGSQNDLKKESGVKLS
jgi:hypothetical protein